MHNNRWEKRPRDSNWGEFGVDDEVGRLNLLSNEIRLRAFREVKKGLTFCLSLPLDYPGGNKIFPFRKEPELVYERRGAGYNFNFRYADQDMRLTDVISDDGVLLYTQYSTQWDGLGHLGQLFDANGDGEPEIVYYNGYRGGVELVAPEEGSDKPGAKALGIETMATAGVQGRGVLVDFNKLFGRAHVLIGYDKLMRALGECEVHKGDFLCLYTGYADVVLEMKKSPDKEVLRTVGAVLDGRDQHLLNWITDSEIVAICADNLAVEEFPAKDVAGVDRFSRLPLHKHCIFDLGMHLGELWYFTELAHWLRANKRSSFLLTAPPLRLVGAVGSPVTPIATV